MYTWIIYVIGVVLSWFLIGWANNKVKTHSISAVAALLSYFYIIVFFITNAEYFIPKIVDFLSYPEKLFSKDKVKKSDELDKSDIIE